MSALSPKSLESKDEPAAFSGLYMHIDVFKLPKFNLGILSRLWTGAREEMICSMCLQVCSSYPRKTLSVANTAAFCQALNAV